MCILAQETWATSLLHILRTSIRAVESDKTTNIALLHRPLYYRYAGASDPSYSYKDMEEVQIAPYNQVLQEFVDDEIGTHGELALTRNNTNSRPTNHGRNTTQNPQT